MNEWRVIGTAGMVWCLAACAGDPGRGVPPEVLGKALERSEEGREAFAAGRHEEAVQAYATALDLHRSVENGPGIIRNLVNLAVVSDAAGRKADATEYLAAVERYVATVESTTPAELQRRETQEVLGEARWLRAKRALAAGRAAEACKWLGSARATGGSAALAGRCDNLEARIREQGGDTAGAAGLARRAAVANRRAGQRSEEADSWRILGRVLLGGGDPAGAGEAFRRALDLDRELARAREVGEDLTGLAQAAEAAGDAGRAAVFRERARAAARARDAGR